MKNKFFIILMISFTFQFSFAQNYSLDFDGVDDLVNSPTITDTLHTIEFWINSDTGINGTATCSLPFNFSSAGEWISLNNSASALSGETISINNDIIAPSATNQILTQGWHHIALTSDGLYYTKIYIDGILANMISTNSPVLYNTKIDIGYRTSPSQYGQNPFNGRLDEIRIWKVIKTQMEIQNNMNSELAGNESNLILYYKMDESNSSCDIEDCNSNWNHGMRTGISGINNLPQFSKDIPVLTDVVCGAPINCTNIVNNNHSLDFDGVDDLVTSTVITDTLHTIEFWINPDIAVNGTAQLSLPFNFSTAGEWISLNDCTSSLSGETVSIANDIIPKTATDQILNGGWHHITFTSNGFYYNKIYIDGILANMISTSSEVIYNTKVDIGYRTFANQIGKFPFNGRLDEIRIWKVTRTQTEIQNNMNKELTGNEAGLILYYKMDNTNSICDIEDCNSNWKHGVRSGISGTNNFPQYSTDVPVLIDVACGATTNCLITSIEPALINAENMFKVFPNPTNGETIIFFNQNMNNCTVRILNLTGQKIFEKINYTGNQLNVNISNQANGVYFTEIEQNGSITRTKLIKK